jgi:hypothetical protein
MVVMEGVCGEAAASSHHRAWYDTNPASTASVASTAAASSQQDQLDAYFKGSNATTAAYFSQMQGAYPGMSYHGKTEV